ncbi:MAG TPA: hypothetical protein VG797_06545 [Phycisphaerales bacterium]|nr:hypothetical protein [Phycisphaerales bacterium]
MRPVLRRIGSLRWHLVLLTLPYALLWKDLPGSGGATFIIVYAMLVLYYGTNLDLSTVAARRDPPIALFRGRETLDPDFLAAARTFLIGLIIIGLIGLTIIQWRLGLVATAMFFFIMFFGGVFARSGKPRSFWPELLWPITFLIFPAFVLGAQGDPATSMTDEAIAPRQWSMPRPMQAATVLGAMLLCAYILICQLRDRIADASIGLKTPATLSRASGAAILGLILFAVIGLACWGAAGPLWTWLVPALIAWGAVLTILALAREADGWAAGTWAATAILTGFTLAASAS